MQRHLGAAWPPTTGVLRGLPHLQLAGLFEGQSLSRLPRVDLWAPGALGNSVLLMERCCMRGCSVLLVAAVLQLLCALPIVLVAPMSGWNWRMDGAG
jgi:hypothetical protein